MPVAEFQKMLDSHDWYYDWSDDHGVWKRGIANHNRIVEIAKTTAEFARMYDDVWFKHFCPPNFNTSRDKAPMVSLGLYTL